LPESDSDNNFLLQPNALTKIRLYPENKIWIRIILLSWVNKQLWILIPSLNIPHCHKHSNNLFISQGSIQILPGGQKLICLRWEGYKMICSKIHQTRGIPVANLELSVFIFYYPKLLI
jgi:hypothetical protein